MGMTSEQYRDQLLALQPPGAALPSDPDSAWALLLHALADEYMRADRRGHALFEEVDVRTTYELLGDWERVTDLPNKNCVQPETVIQRRRALHDQLANSGGQSLAYFIELAEHLGYPISVTEYRRPLADQVVVGEALTYADWVFTFKVSAPETTVTVATAGHSAAGEPLRTWGNTVLECVINQRKPAHSVVLYSYGG